MIGNWNPTYCHEISIPTYIGKKQLKDDLFQFRCQQILSSLRTLRKFYIINLMVQEYIAVCQEKSANALILSRCCNIWARESQNEMCTALHKVFTIFHARGNELPRATSINFQKIWR